jgi:hypothetical protein
MRQRLAIALGLICALAWGLVGSAAPAPPPDLLSQYTWTMDDRYFGGLSALAVTPDGLGLTVLSDSGAYAQGRITRDDQGRITHVALAPFAALRGLGTAPLTKGRDDSEGLAIDAQGVAYISFEGVARVLRYARLDGPAENLPTPAAFARFPRNAALEALAIDAKGRLYTLPERSGGATKPFPIYRFANGQWDAQLSLPRDSAFLPVGADFGPDGRLYILQRQFHGIAGFSTRLIRVTVQDDQLGPIEVLLQTKTGDHGNLEGLSIWRNALGQLCASMVADNNYLPFLPTQIVEYRLPD